MNSKGMAMSDRIIKSRFPLHGLEAALAALRQRGVLGRQILDLA